jgi:hypothetical protein
VPADNVIDLRAARATPGAPPDVTDADGRPVGTHSIDVCAGRTCPVHNPSDHPLAAAPLRYRQGRAGLLDRVCGHGLAHPDPDATAHFAAADGRAAGPHRCDGCCRPPLEDNA